MESMDSVWRNLQMAVGSRDDLKHPSQLRTGAAESDTGPVVKAGTPERLSIGTPSLSGRNMMLWRWTQPFRLPLTGAQHGMWVGVDVSVVVLVNL